MEVNTVCVCCSLGEDLYSEEGSASSEVEAIVPVFKSVEDVTLVALVVTEDNIVLSGDAMVSLSWEVVSGITEVSFGVALLVDECTEVVSFVENASVVNVASDFVVCVGKV